MCVIVYKPKNIKFEDIKDLKDCFDYNNDGAGFAFNGDDVKGVKIQKGFMKYQDFIKAIKKVKNINNRDVLMHFRIKTSGATNGATCHPYPLTSNIKDLQALEINSSVAMVHNGVLSNVDIEKGLNDTQSFIKNFLSYFKPNFYKNIEVKKQLENFIGANKLAFIDSKGVTLFNDFILGENGCYYSNHNHKFKKYNIGTYNFQRYNYNYSSYYDDLYNDDINYYDDIDNYCNNLYNEPLDLEKITIDDITNENVDEIQASLIDKIDMSEPLTDNEKDIADCLALHEYYCSCDCKDCDKKDTKKCIYSGGLDS